MVQGLYLRVCRIGDFGFTVQGSRFKVYGVGCRVQGSEFKAGGLH